MTKAHRWAVTALTGAAMCVATATLPSDAHACGGCFAPISSTTVVTAHRMAVSLSSESTTLWDQIEYAGNPEDFAWVLPVARGVEVEVASQAFFTQLQQMSQVQLQGTFAPLRTFCPDPCVRASPGAAFDSDTSADAGTASPPVEVIMREVVGPYDTVTLRSEDSGALLEWLDENDYNIDASLMPTIQHYVDAGLDFLALRLAPGEGVTSMQPVRVTVPGLMPIFPLRMVAAGVQDKVGLQLFVISEGRWGTQNFDVAEVETARLAYDWSSASFNYEEIFDDTLRAAGGRAWIAELARPLQPYEYDGSTSYYDPGTGMELDTADDWSVASRGLSAPYVTALRSDLAVRYLDEDLVLAADTGGDVSAFISVSREVNRPAEPSCATTCMDTSIGGDIVRGGSAAGTGAPVSLRSAGGGGIECGVRPGPREGGLFGGLALASLALVTARRRRRR